jgi:hypothetical protein
VCVCVCVCVYCVLSVSAYISLMWKCEVLKETVYVSLCACLRIRERRAIGLVTSSDSKQDWT